MSNKLMLVGVAGPAGAGKDTVGDWLVRYHGFEKRAVAGTLKAGLAAMGLPEPHDRAQKEKIIPGLDFSWRDAAQKLGTEWGRALNPDLWLLLIQQHVQVCLVAGQPLVITDIRFDNEAAMVRHHGGLILHVTGRKADMAGKEFHASEKGIAFHAGDKVIMNDGTMEELAEQLQELIHG